MRLICIVGAILHQIYEYCLIYMHANWTGIAKSDSTVVCVQFACISPFACALWITCYFVSHLHRFSGCKVPSFSESSPN